MIYFHNFDISTNSIAIRTVAQQPPIIGRIALLFRNAMISKCNVWEKIHMFDSYYSILYLFHRLCSHTTESYSTLSCVLLRICRYKATPFIIWSGPIPWITARMIMNCLFETDVCKCEPRDGPVQYVKVEVESKEPMEEILFDEENDTKNKEPEHFYKYST